MPPGGRCSRQRPPDAGCAGLFKPRISGGFFALHGRHFLARNLPATPLLRGRPGFRTKCCVTAISPTSADRKGGRTGRVALKVRAVSGSFATHPLGIYEWGKHQYAYKTEAGAGTCFARGACRPGVVEYSVGRGNGCAPPTRWRRTSRTSPGPARRFASSSASSTPRTALGRHRAPNGQSSTRRSGSARGDLRDPVFFDDTDRRTAGFAGAGEQAAARAGRSTSTPSIPA